MTDNSPIATVGARQPRLLFVATMPWPFAARLAKACRRVGFDVSAVCRLGHPLRYLREPIKVHGLGFFREAASVLYAIEVGQPDFIVPCDDPSVELLHGLHHGHVGTEVGRAIERSLGDPRHYAVTSTRSALVAAAANLGVDVPPGESVRDRASLDREARRLGFPVVIKRDRTWGGTGVVVAKDEGELDAGWLRITGSINLLRALKAAVRDRRPRTALDIAFGPAAKVEVQKYIPGPPANRAVLCHQGRVVEGISVSALQTAYPGGPASVVRVIDHRQMTDVAAAITEKLGLSGFCGFDFIIDTDGRAHLLELNPRATPICHLAVADGSHLAAALYRELTGRAPEKPPHMITRDVIALFPTEWQRDPTGAGLAGAFPDAPWDEPALLAKAGCEGLHPPGFAGRAAGATGR